MPDFAKISAYIVIDTMTLLLWHQVVMSRVLSTAHHFSHLKPLIDQYLRQCQPLPLLAIHWARFTKPGIAITLQSTPLDTLD